MLRSSLAISNQGRFFANRLEYKSREFLNRFFVTLFAYVLFYYSTCVISSFIFPCTFLLVACERKIVFCMSSANIFLDSQHYFAIDLNVADDFFMLSDIAFLQIYLLFLTGNAKITAVKYLLLTTNHNYYIS